MRLGKSQESFGYFWLPESSDTKVPGILRATDLGSVTLDLLGTFADLASELASTSSVVRRIVGALEDGTPVTLDNCHYENRKLSLGGGISRIRIHVSLLLRGAIFEPDEEVKFSRLKFSFECLDEWLSVSGLSASESEDLRKASISFSVPDGIAAQLPDGVSLAVEFNWTIPGRPMIREAKLTQKAYITLASRETRPLEYFQKLAHRLNNFFCLASDTTASLDFIAGFAPDIADELDNGARIELPVQLIYESIPTAASPPKFDFQKILLPYSAIADDLERILSEWLLNYEKFEPAFGLYFASRRRAHGYLESRFLSLSQGLETLHRRSSDETKFPESEYESIKKAILENCPTGYRKWLESKLAYGNEIPLRKRLDRVIEPFATLLGDARKRKSFVSKVVDTRNFHTHYDSKLKRSVANSRELVNICSALEGIFRLHFLQMIGIAPSRIREIAISHRGLRSDLQI